MDDNQLGVNSISVDVLDRDLDKIGRGPVASCLTLQTSRPLNMARSFNATFPANDPRTEYIVEKETVLDFFHNGRRIFRGIPEATEIALGADGQRILSVEGRCIGAELAEATVGFLELTEPDAEAVANGPALVLAEATTTGGTTWTLDTTNGYAFTSTKSYGQFGGESALAALIKIGEQIGEHWRFADDWSRRIIWMQDDTPVSGVRCIGGAGESVQVEDNPFVCLIQRFSEATDCYDQITRIYPFGAGVGDARQTLFQSNRSAPSGFALDKANNCIINTTAETALGKAIPRYVEYKEIRPISNTFFDLRSAANALYDAALYHLRRNDERADNKSYDLTVLKLPEAVHPGSTVRVIYDDDHYSVDGDFVVMQIHTSIDGSGEAIYSLTVSQVVKHKAADADAITGTMERGRVMSAYPQRNANSYIYNERIYIGESQGGGYGEIFLDFGPEVVQIQQVLLRIAPLRSMAPATTVAGTTATSGASSITTTASGGGTTETTAGGSSHVHNINNHEHRATVANGTGSRNITGDIVGGAIVLRYDGSSDGDKSFNTSLFAGSTTSESESTHTHSVTIPDHTHNMEHTHDVDLSSAISTQFGVFQAPLDDTYDITDIEYNINSAGWNSLSPELVDLGSGRYAWDITSVLVDSDSLRQEQDINRILFRRSIAAGTGKTIMLSISVQVRNIIQAIAYA